MIDLYTYSTSNGRRASVALEECRLPYRVHRIDIEKGEQRRRSFLKINPMGQIPAIVDHDGPGGKTLSLAQSGAIVLSAAEKSGRLLPKSPVRRALAYQWFTQAMSDVAPASAALFYVSMWVPGKPKAARTYFKGRLIDALRHCDRRLGEAPYLAGEFSIADVALFPTVAVRSDIIAKAKGLNNLKRWAERVGARPAVKRGMAATG